MTADANKRWALAAGAAGLVGGLALGATGLASAVTPSPSPGDKQEQAKQGKGKPSGEKKPGTKRRGTGGLVTQISASSLTLRTAGGTKTITLTSSTEFFEGKTKASRSDVEVGEIVKVLLAERTADSTVASRVHVVPARLGGWVTGVDGSQVTVTDRGGFTRVIRTTSSTEVTKDGAKTTPAAITVGSFVHAVGTVADDGTTLEASTVHIGQPRKGAFHKGGRGGADEGASSAPDE